MFDITGISSTIKVVVIGLVVSALVGGIGCFIYDYNKTVKLAAEAAQWKNNFEQAEKANKENQQAITDLEKASSKFEGILKDREAQIDAINQEVWDKDERITQLGKENEQIRADLDYIISCGLWREIFPHSTVCPNTNESGADKGSGKPPATAPGTTGTKNQ